MNMAVICHTLIYWMSTVQRVAAGGVELHLE